MCVIALVGAIATPPVWAQDNDADTEADEAGGEFGGGLWLPSLTTSGFYTDNFYNEETRSADAVGTLIAPRMTYRTEARRVDLKLASSAEYGTFDTPGSGDDYLDVQVDGFLTYNAGTRHRLSLSALLRHDHDPFGINRTEDASARADELDRWNQGSGGIRYRFGAAGAAVNAEFGLNASSKQYITNRSATASLGYDTVGVDYALYYNPTPKSSVLFDVQHTDISVDEPFVAGVPESRDGGVIRARVGARWLATAKTSGDVRFGVRRRDFDNGAESKDALDWQAGVRWTARPKTLLSLNTARSEAESYVVNARFLDIKIVALSWLQTITPRIRSTVNLDTSRVSFIGSARRDDILAASLGGEYLLRRYLYLHANVEHTTRDSSTANRDYDRVNGYIGFRIGR